MVERALGATRGAAIGAALLAMGSGAGGASAASVDPTGDGWGPRRPDLTRYTAAVVGDTLVLELRFASPLGVPGDDLFGFLDLDLDQDPESGSRGSVDFLTPLTSGLGNEVRIPLHSYEAQSGEVEVIDEVGGRTLGRVPLSRRDDRLAVALPLALLGDDGAVHTAAVVGSADAVTDVAPNGGHLATVAVGPPVRLREERFEVAVTWGDFTGASGSGNLAVRSDDSAVFTFFDPDNWELLVKVLDGCGVNGHFWVFAAATSNLELTLAVRDTASGEVWLFHNPLGTAAPAVTDTEALATCP